MEYPTESSSSDESSCNKNFDLSSLGNKNYENNNSLRDISHGNIENGTSFGNEMSKGEGEKTFDFSDGKNNIDPRKVFNFLSNLLNVKVVVERLSDFTLKKYQRKSPTISNIALGHTKEDVTLTVSSSKLDTVSYGDKKNQIIKIFSPKVVVEKLQDFTIRKYQASSTSSKMQLDSTSENVTSAVYSNIDMVSHHDERIRKTDNQPTLFTCDMCRKSFGQRGSLKSHVACCKSKPENLPNRKELYGKSSTRVLTTRYCLKCKKLVEHDQSLSVCKIQHCKSCNSGLHLQCVKCDKRYRRYCDMRKHLKQCNKISTNESSEPSSCHSRDVTSRYCLKCKKSVGHGKFRYIDSIEHCGSCKSRLLWQCNECGKRTANYYYMRCHLRNGCNFSYKKQSSSFSHGSRVVDLIPNLSHQKMGIRELTKMYCSKCDVLVGNAIIFNVLKDQSCVKCNTTMQWQCLKCNKRYTKYKGMHHHVRYTLCNSNKRYNA